jgi:hypothetical protein
MGGSVSSIMGICAFIVTFYSEADQTVGLVMDSFKILEGKKTESYSKRVINRRINVHDIDLL